ncbi:BON domain-containing protein [Oceanispirochaeta sp. M1]|nr:BON domain-containing protein [Oceanispirochaeta sp. M1]
MRYAPQKFSGVKGQIMPSKADSLKNNILEAVKKNDFPIIMTAVLVSVVKKGSFFSPSLEVQLSGRVDKESDQSTIERIAAEVAGDVPVVSTLRFKS